VSKEASTDVDPRVRRDAIAWFVRLSAGDATEADREACEVWRRQHPQHEYAWARLEAVRGVLAGVPGDIAAPTLNTLDSERRKTLKRLALLAFGAGGSWLVLREQPWRARLADHRTAVGERREIALSDGTALTLNTASAIDVLFDASTRLLHLHEGEVMIRTAHAPDEHRPLIVQTRHGSTRALGTRFIVRAAADLTRVCVLESAVEIHSGASSNATHVRAGQQSSFDEHRIAEAAPMPAGTDAWASGRLIVDDWPLAAVIEELARYRPGRLRCAPEVAGIRVSGVFPVEDTGRALAMLADRFPISVSETTRYWVTVDARR
jgi:transmembrane sensor